MRRCLIILGLACFIASATGASLALHLHIWHGDHGDDSHHDSDKCPICQTITFTLRAVVGNAPVLAADVEPQYQDSEPATQTPQSVSAHSPVAPRAPPLLAL